MALISVIIPVYNVEDYLRECLDSICNQTFEDIEIICVNDGSTDSSLDILKQYESEDDRIRVISQENKGVSGARNAAMDYITAKYTYFMDSDDILELDALEKLYDIAEEKSTDMIIFKILNFDNESKEKQPTNYYDMAYLKEEVSQNIFANEDLPSDMIFKIAVTPASKFYRSDVLKDIRFPMGLIFEDNAFFIESFLKCKRMYFHDEYLSNKRVRKGSITHTPNESFMDFIDISEILIDITKKLNLYPELKEGLFYKIIPNLYLRFTQVPQDIKPEFFNKIKEYFTSKKEEYDRDEVFQMCDDRVKEIFYSGIESENPREYELSIKCLDLTNLLEKTELKLNENIEIKTQYTREKLKLFNRSKELSLRLNELANENRELKGDS